MASRFAALAEDPDDSASSGASGPAAAASAAPPAEPASGDDDEGYLDAFFHNHKPSRHLGAAAARRAARKAAAKDEDGVEDDRGPKVPAGGPGADEALAALQAGLAAAALRDGDEEEEEGEDDDEGEGEEEDEEGDRAEEGGGKSGQKRVSKKENSAELAGFQERMGQVRLILLDEFGMIGKQMMGKIATRCQQAERRALRKQEKVERKMNKGQKAEDAAADGTADGAAGDGAADENDGGGKHVSKAEAKRRKELEKHTRKAERKEAEKLESDIFAAQAGSGVLDVRYRRQVLGCPSAIAPVEGKPHIWEIARGYVPGMKGPARFFADEELAVLCLEEASQAGGGFLPAVMQLANVATLPGLMGCSLGMPDIHSGYGFAVGSVAAIDLTHPDAVVSPGGVGFDINCGVRLLRTNLTEKDVQGRRCAELATAIFEAVPTGVGADGAYTPKNEKELRDALDRGMKWALDKGLCWEEDLHRTEEGGAMPGADSNAVSNRALKRGSPQLGTLGSGNHYLEVQVVDEIFDEEAARVMGLPKGGICVMIHCGSRGLGHQLCTDYLQTMGVEMVRQGISVPDRQLCCVRAASPAGQQYLRGMAAAANYAFVNRTIIAHSVRNVFRRVFHKNPRDELEMHVVYDVSHNIAKQEEHTDPADGKRKPALVHRKGATRSFPPGHEALPEVYKPIGQPVLIGGSMGTCSYVLAGNPESMELSFGSTCHGAGRRMSRAQSLRKLSAEDVLAKLRAQGIEVRVASPKLIAEEADESYKDVNSVVKTCHEVGISRLVAKLRPLAVIKG